MGARENHFSGDASFGIIAADAAFSWLIDFVAPFMKWLGLSGDAAVPLVLGNLLGLYAAIGAMLTIEFTVKEVLILAIMLSFAIT